MQLTNKSQNIFLIGMMGSGKSSIAPLLSKKLNVDHTFIDLLIDVFNQKKHPNELLKNTIGNI